MSYLSFMPWTLQKRLLRFLLSQLDFLETDQLKLEDLDITWGQRSVVELKNVGLKTKKLVSLFSKPEALDIKSACISLLKLTVPADILSSGIEVDISGVDVRLRLRHTTGVPERAARGEKHRANSRGTQSNWPRKATPSVHDPGGLKNTYYGQREETLLHPELSAHHLAESFLQTETREDRLQFHAAITSRGSPGRELPGARAFTEDEAAMGLGEGYGLPSFIASYLVGVTDRLQLTIRDVSTHIEVEQPRDALTTDSLRSTDFLITLSELRVDGVGVSDGEDSTYEAKRDITAKRLCIFVTSDLGDETPGPGSPQTASPTFKHVNLNRSGSMVTAKVPATVSGHHNLERSPEPRPFLSRSRSSSSSSDDRFFQGSMNFPLGMDASTSDGDMEESRLSTSTNVDNQRRAQVAVRSGHPHETVETQPPTMDVEDLTESRLFTHDEAESMYMSAMSTGQKSDQEVTTKMPGAWDGAQESQESLQSRTGFQSLRELDEPSGGSIRSISQQKAIDLHIHDRDGLIVPLDSSTQLPTTAKLFVFVDQISASGATDRDPTFQTPTEMAKSSQPDQQDKVMGEYDNQGKDMENPRSDVGSVGSRLSLDRDKVSTNPVSAPSTTNAPRLLNLELGEVRCQFDIQLGKTLVGALFGHLNDGADPSGDGRTEGLGPAFPAISVKINNLEVNLLERVPNLELSAASFSNVSSEEASLLSISVTGLNGQSSSVAGIVQQRIRIEKLRCSHSRGPVLAFTDEARMKLIPDDVFAAGDNDVDASISSKGGLTKVEIQTKTISLNLDLGQIDEILSKSGGLSNLLELGSPISSTGTIRKTTRKKTASRPVARGVRFETPTHGASKGQDEPGNGLGKLNLRISGITLNIVGSQSTLRASTSAVKVVYRTEGLGMQIDKLRVLGPYFSGAGDQPAMVVELNNLRTEYLAVPNDKDLDRLLAILTPSNDMYDDDDDIMVDTLLRQRRKGAVLRLTLSSLSASLDGTTHVEHLMKIADELGRLSSVTKYLPEDDRPGILVLGLFKTLELSLKLDEIMSSLQMTVSDFEFANVSIPSLLAAQIRRISIKWNETRALLREAVTYSGASKVPPMVMCRFVADEMEPTVKIKLFNICVEYHVSLIMALQSSADPILNEKSEYGSERSITSEAQMSSPSGSESAAEFVKKTNISLAIRDSSIALNPHKMPGRALLLLTDAILSSPLNDQKLMTISGELKKGSIMVIDKAVPEPSEPPSHAQGVVRRREDQTSILQLLGYISLGYLSSAKASISIGKVTDVEAQSIDVELSNALLILESCADSTQTLIQLLGDMSPPPIAPKNSPYRTEIMPIEDLLASFSGDAFVTQPGPETGLRAQADDDSDIDDSDSGDVEYVSEFYPSDEEEEDNDDISESGIRSEMLDSDLVDSVVSISVAPVSIKPSSGHAAQHGGLANSLLDFREEHFGRTTDVGGTAHRWDSTKDTYELASQGSIKKSPLRARVHGIHIIWNLFDGYDWQNTRNVISEAVKDLETKASSRKSKTGARDLSIGEEDDGSVIADFLFNSIYIGIPANKDPHELAKEISRDIDDVTSETSSYAPSTTIPGSPARQHRGGRSSRRLRLERSKQHKMTFELKGVSADLMVFPPGSGEVQSSIDIRVKDLDVFDHVPTSTWKKFATYMRDAGEKEADTSMIHLEVLNVKPVADLAASEIILKITILPLRLHVDQDALDFMSRFFEFKDDDDLSPPSTSTPPFLQRVEVNPIKIKLDFKPKRVDYGGLRSGRTTEFMNFFVLDQADMVLRRVILYGVSGFDRLGIMLNNIWTPDVRRNQLPGILAGLAPIRSLVNVGSGVRDLVVIPMREYKKDGRIVRSIQKGALAFAKTTSKELIGLGAKLAIGTQTVLQNAESLLAPTSPDGRNFNDPDADDDIDSQEKRQISLYADQPIGVVQGLRGAYASLERDLLLAKDAIIAIPGEAMETGSAAGAARAVLKQAPTIILRPAIGASKAVGKTLLGAGNTLDRENWRRNEEKYKRH